MADVGDLSGAYGPFDTPGDEAIAKLAGRQHGVVATWQLKELGYSQSAIRRRTRTARLHRLYRGVYAVGHTRITLRGRWMAAVLACGRKAVLSHRSAAALWGLRPSPSGQIDVTVTGGSARGQTGIRLHRTRSLHPEDRATLDGIPVTSVARTMLDYAEDARAPQLRSALEAAERLDLLTNEALDGLFARSPGRRGRKSLTRALAQMRGRTVPWTQSELERHFLELIREAALPEPQANVYVGGVLVDFFWPAQRLVVEVDGYNFHKTRRSFEDDRRKDAKLQLAGCRVLRVTEARIARGPRAMLRDVRALLNASW